MKDRKPNECFPLLSMLRAESPKIQVCVCAKNGKPYWPRGLSFFFLLRQSVQRPEKKAQKKRRHSYLSLSTIRNPQNETRNFGFSSFHAPLKKPFHRRRNNVSTLVYIRSATRGNQLPDPKFQSSITCQYDFMLSPA